MSRRSSITTPTMTRTPSPYSAAKSFIQSRWMIHVVTTANAPWTAWMNQRHSRTNESPHTAAHVAATTRRYAHGSTAFGRMPR
jgi:hypothetical protein